VTLEIKRNQLHWGGASCEALAEKFGTPLFVYDEGRIRSQARGLKKAFSHPKVRLLYSCKANSNLAVLKALREEGLGLDAVSPGEIFLGLKAGFKPRDILFTGNNVTDEEMRFALSKGVGINVDSLPQLERFGKLRPGGEVSVRINPDVGEGHHDHVITGGPESKFGIWMDQVTEIKRIARKHDLRIIGLHQHIGSGVMEAEVFLDAMEVLLQVAPGFEDLEFLDFGGGLGVPYAPGQRPLDVRSLGRMLSQRFLRFCEKYGRTLTLVLEPGRYFVAEAGVLLTRVNTIKATPEHTFVGTDSGFNHLIRHSLYGAHHEILNASRVKGAREFAAVCGNVCESGDLFTHGREITRFAEGNLAAILNAGAYGFSMSMEYNSRPRPAEVLVHHGKARLIRKRETLNGLLRNQI